MYSEAWLKYKNQDKDTMKVCALLQSYPNEAKEVPEH